jgi:7-cyano-7-deazaguanine synthase
MASANPADGTVQIMKNQKKAVVLSSGGLDSTTAMAMFKQDSYEIYSLSFNYGQRHALELKAAEEIAKVWGAKQHLVINIDLRIIGGSALTDDLDVPKAGSGQSRGAAIPVTYVPARNTIFLSYALAWAEVLGATDIVIGVNAIDYSGYPDCRPEYIEAFERMANLGIKACVEEGRQIRIKTPLMTMNKGQIIRAGLALGVDYRKTHSCYDPSEDGLACGRCDSCVLRKKGFEDAGVPDPTTYRSYPLKKR